MQKSIWRILLADDDPIVRDFLRAFFSRSKKFTLVGEAIEGKEVLRQVDILRPHILLLDMLLPDRSGLDVLSELMVTSVTTRTILLCSTITKRQVAEALNLGVRGVVLKDAIDEMEHAADAVMDGQYWINGKSVTNVFQEMREISKDVSALEGAPVFGMTNRELEIVNLVARGLSNKEISKNLGITEDTVKGHLSNIFNKVGMSTRLELALFARDHNLISRSLPKNRQKN